MHRDFLMADPLNQPAQPEEGVALQNLNVYCGASEYAKLKLICKLILHEMLLPDI